MLQKKKSDIRDHPYSSCADSLTFSEISVRKLAEITRVKDIVSPYMNLHKLGNSSYCATCPFCDDKGHSFVIQKEGISYRCSNCSALGDSRDFLMGYLDLTFVEAVEEIAKIYDIKKKKKASAKKKK